MPAPEPRTRASTSSSPAGPDRQSSSQTIFSTECVQARVIAPATGARSRSCDEAEHQPIAGVAARRRQMEADERGRQHEANLVGDRERRDQEHAGAVAQEPLPPEAAASGNSPIAAAPEAEGQRRLDHDVDHRQPVAGRLEAGTGCSISAGS